MMFELSTQRLMNSFSIVRPFGPRRHPGGSVTTT
jgi:hypothetical protein